MSARSRASGGMSLLVAVGLGATAADADAGGILDYIRNYDLNDYALGVAVTTAESPYVGDAGNTYGYPYLTSFRYAGFTDDWLLLSGGELGVRWVTDNGWVLGVVGRINTDGFGSGTDQRLLSLRDRHWAVEVAPLVGWRGWPLHVEYKLFSALINRHDGLTGEFKLSLPTEWSRGYVVPSISVISHDAAYNDYYYGVGASFPAPGFPFYAPGAGTSIEARLKVGYAITDKWLASGYVASEWLGAAISDSPIVDRDRLWSLNFGLAYNADIFHPREGHGTGLRQPRFEIRAGTFRSTIDSEIRYESTNGGAPDIVDLEDRLDAAAYKYVWQVDAILRIGGYHRLEAGHFRLSRESTAVLTAPMRAGNEELIAGTTVLTRTETRVTRLVYGYSLMNDAQKELGVMAGLHVTRFDNEITPVGAGQYVRSYLSTPLPVIGAYARLALGSKVMLDARLHIFRTTYDTYSGSLNYLYLGLQRSLGKTSSVGLGLNYYGLDLDSNDAGLRGSIRVRYYGPVVFLGINFE